MNYCDIEEIKSELGITSEDDDDMLEAMCGQATTIIDDYCQREFDKSTEVARYFDGAGSRLWIDDLVSISTSGLKLDEDGDGTYESTLATTDYILYPLNTTPKYRIELSHDSDYGGFANGIRKGVSITGYWGYSAIPTPIIRAAMKLVVAMYNNRNTGGKLSERLGDYSYSLDNSKDLPTEITKLLDPYRKVKV